MTNYGWVGSSFVMYTPMQCWSKLYKCLLVCAAGLFNMLSDNSHEIRQQADSALAEFLQEIKNAPVQI